MLKQLSIFGVLLFTAASGEDNCSNQNRDDCPNNSADVGPDTAGIQALESTSGVYPSPKEQAMTVCKDAGLQGSCTNVWTGMTNVVPNGWNDVVSSAYIKEFYSCAFYCDGYGGRYMTTLNGPYNVNWINSWNDCISSWKCLRRCNTKQDHCDKAQSGCIDNTHTKCKTCHIGYVRNSSGKCVEDVTCTAVELIIKTVEPSSETAGLPDEMTLGEVHEDNCQSSTPAQTVVTTTKTVSHMVDSTYSFSKSFANTMGQSMSTTVGLTVKGEIIPGFGVDASTSITSGSTWSNTVTSASTSTTKQTNTTTEVWSHAATITTSPYHNMTYTSVGRQTPGTIQWTGTMNCYNNVNKLIKSKDVSGKYAGATISTWDEVRVETPCGAPSGFTLEKDVHCNDNEIDTGLTYPTLYDAQNACQELAEKCYGVMDKACDGTLDYYLCANNGVALKPSKIDSCVYKQIQEDSIRDLAARLSAAEAKLMQYA